MKPAKIFVLSLLFLFSAAPCWVVAQTGGTGEIDKNDPQQVLAYQGDAVLTQAAIDGAFSRIPEQNRLEFIRDGAKVDTLVKSLLQAEVVAQDADRSGFSTDPVVMERVRLAARKELAEAWVQEQANRMPEADYAEMAYEDYLAHPQKYASETTLDLTHILIGTEDRTEEEALDLAKDLRARLAEDPDQFDSMVEEYSDDPSVKSNAGRFKNVGRGRMVKPFEQAAFALTAPGQISEPVKTEFGYHLIRLDRRHEPEVPPFEEVKGLAEAQMKAKHAEAYRVNFLQRLLKDPVVFPDGSVEIMARRYFGEDLEKARIYSEDGVK